jgi:histone acetyltransferase (RNA polymerase elongator complex component)
VPWGHVPEIEHQARVQDVQQLYRRPDPARLTQGRKNVAKKTDKGGCPEAIGNCFDDGKGKCSYCGRRMAKAPAPKVVPPTRLDVEYRRHYDPDFGTDDRDV